MNAFGRDGAAFGPRQIRGCGGPGAGGRNSPIHALSWHAYNIKQPCFYYFTSDQFPAKLLSTSILNAVIAEPLLYTVDNLVEVWGSTSAQAHGHIEGGLGQRGKLV